MKTIVKPYDMQTNESNWPSDREIDQWFENLNHPILNILVGMPKCGKTSFVNKYGIQGFNSAYFNTKPNRVDCTREINIINTSWSRREIKKGIKNKDSFVVDCENLTAKSRYKFLKQFPDEYQKIAIIWELSESELLKRGCGLTELKEKGKIYERPSRDEGYDELVYIFS